jgi:hypothetical protein
MELTVEIPDKYGEKLGAVEDVDPSIRDQIEIETLPHVLRLINDAHRQIEAQGPATPEDRSIDDGS